MRQSPAIKDIYKEVEEIIILEADARQPTCADIAD
jgi:hypothetical protein